MVKGRGPIKKKRKRLRSFKKKRKILALVKEITVSCIVREHYLAGAGPDHNIGYKKDKKILGDL